MATRYERVVLDLEDKFSSPTLRAAAAAGVLDKALNDLDGSTVDVDRSTTRLGSPRGGLAKTAVQSRTVSREIDRFSGRLRLLADTAAILGPAFIPIAAVGIPALTGLAAQFGAAAIAGGTAIIAFQGVGDALEAVNEAALEPTAENLEAARLAMQNLAPEARAFVREIQSMRPAFQAMQQAAAAGVFPGLTRALGDAEGAFDRVEQILFRVGDAAGDLAEDFAEGLAGPRGQEFLAFIEAEVPSALTELGHTVGNLAGGLAEMWMAFTPLNRDFSGWLLQASRGFDDWAQGLAETEGFQEFVAYIRDNGPRVADALGAIGSAVLDIVEAAAPLGGPVLEALTAIANVISAIADSGAGPAIMATVTALALLNRGMSTFGRVSGSAWGTSIKGADTFAGKMKAAHWGRGAAAIAGIGIAASGVADGFGLANAAQGALIGSLGGPLGAAVGGGVGLMLDLASASGEAAARAEELRAALEQGGRAAAQDNIISVLENEGILEDAEALGLGLDTVTAAAMGNRDALSALRAEQRALQGEQRATTDQFGFDTGPDSDEARERAAAISAVIQAITGENKALNEARGSARRKEEANRGLAESYGQAQSAAEAFRDGVIRLNNILEGRATLRDYEQSLDDFTEGLKENGHTLDINTQKGRDNQAALDGIVSSAIQVAETMKRSERAEFLKQARKDFVDATAGLLGSEEAARKLWDRLVQLDKTEASPKINADASGAIRMIDLIKAQMRYLDGLTSITYVDTVRRNRVSGGLQEFAHGGYTGLGAKYEPAGIVHRGEYVFSAEATRGRERDLDQLHRQLRGYASGGVVDQRAFSSTPSGSGGGRMTVDLGDLHVTGTLQSDLGPVRIEGIARAAARSEIAADRTYQTSVSPRNRTRRRSE